MNESFPVFVNRWLTSDNVSRMSLEAQGWYFRLLCWSWRHGAIPDDPERCAQISGVSHPAMIGRLSRDHWPIIRRSWADAPDGGLRNPVLEEVRKSVQNQKQRQSARGKAGNFSRWDGSLRDRPCARARGSSIQDDETREPTPPQRGVGSRSDASVASRGDAAACGSTNEGSRPRAVENARAQSRTQAYLESISHLVDPEILRKTPL